MGAALAELLGVLLPCGLVVLGLAWFLHLSVSARS